MKATIDIPDELYRRVKAKSALRGQPVREVAVSLFRAWMAEPGEAMHPSPLQTTHEPAPVWFGMARRYARQGVSHDMATIRESIVKGRAEETTEAATGRGNS